MRRREFITLPAIYVAAASKVFPEINVPLRFFTAPEAAVVSAASERILPADESGPGARDAGVVVYIDRQLAGPYGRDKYRYTKSPWVESTPEHGYQGKATPREIYREGIGKLGEFASLTAEQQDEKLMSIEKSTFFQLLRTHTIEGMLSDPMHGGNAGMIGWQMVGYPGPLMSFRDDLEKYRGVPYGRKPVSLSQVVGRPVKGWEEEIG